MINLFLGVALVVTPFFIKAGPRTSADVSQHWLFAILTLVGAVFFGVSSNKRIKLMSLAIAGIAFLPRDPFGVYALVQLALCMAGILFVGMVYAHREHIKIEVIARALGLVCIIESLFIFLNKLGVDPYFEWFHLAGVLSVIPDIREIGSLGNINHSGALVAVTLPFLSPLLWPVALLALYFSSTLPVICGIVSIISLYSYRRVDFRPFIVGAFALFMAAMAVGLELVPYDSYFSGGSRVRAWTELARTVGLQFMGKGLGWLPLEFSKKLISNEHFYQAHNEWVELYAIGGFLSVVVGVYLIAPVFKNKGNPAINASLISLLVNSLGNFTFHIAPLFMVFGTCYALQLGEE